MVPNYWPDGVRGEPGLCFERGEGCTLTATDGRTFLDFMSGIAVNSLGHSDPAWAKAVSDQAYTLAHTSNLFHTAPPLLLAQRLVELAPPNLGKIFFCNSGTEANEAALKFATMLAKSRAMAKKTKVQDGGNNIHDNSQAPASRVIAFHGNFHGRTMGALSITHKPAIREPFFATGACEMGLGGDGALSSSVSCCQRVKFLPFNDSEALRNAFEEDGENIAAVVVEPVQGEGGVNPARPQWLAEMRQWCDVSGAALIADEVQCGLGRIGATFATEAYSDLTGEAFKADMITLAKPLAGGLPIGAVLCTEDVAKAISPGSHGTTFGGNPLVTAAAMAVVDRLTSPGFMEGVREKGQLLLTRARELQTSFPDYVTAVRAAPEPYGGMFVGMELAEAPGSVIALAREKGLLIISCGEKVIRLVPPLVASKDECEKAMDIVGAAIQEREGEWRRETSGNDVKEQEAGTR